MYVQVQIDYKKSNNLLLRQENEIWPEQINVQEGTEISILNNNAARGFKGFQLSESYDKVNTPLNGNYKFFSSEGYPGLITSQACGVDGIFAPDIAISFYMPETHIVTLWIVFDLVCNEYATEFTVKNEDLNLEETFYADSPIYGIPVSEYLYAQPGEKFTIKIRKWSKPFSSAKITRISAYYNTTFTGADLISMTCSENLLDANMAINPGICEQYADIKVYDRDGMLRWLSHDGELTEDFEVTITAIDKDNTYVLGKYEVDNWDIDGTSYEVGVSCRDISYILSEINVKSIPIQTRTVHDMLRLMFKNIPNISWKYIDTDTVTYCKNIKTPYNWFKNGTLYELLHKICVLAMIRIYWHVDSFVIARCW